MARQFANANVGASGRRRIVPMMGIDFIAGDIKRKDPEYGAGGLKNRGGAYRYGVPPANIGGRTRKWTNVNFFQVNKAGRNYRVPKATETAWREHFSNCAKSTIATIQNPANISRLQTEWRAGTTYYNYNSNQFATMRGWVMAIRIAQGPDVVTPTLNTWPPQGS